MTPIDTWDEWLAKIDGSAIDAAPVDFRAPADVALTPQNAPIDSAAHSLLAFGEAETFASTAGRRASAAAPHLSSLDSQHHLAEQTFNYDL